MASQEKVHEDEDIQPILNEVTTVIETVFQEKQPVITRINTGYLNNVFIVEIAGLEGKKRTVIAKQTPPYMRCFGPSYPLTANRLTLECETLRKYEELCPGSVPKVIAYDLERKILLLENLENFKLLRTELMEGEVDRPALHNLACLLGKLHNRTHVANVPKNQFSDFLKQFHGELVDLSEEYVFEKTFDAEDPTNHVAPECRRHAERIYGNQSLLTNVQSLKQVFLTKKECLVHGDLHTGSVMVHNGVAKLIDTEFAFMGPCSWDLGLLLANYMISYHSHLLTPENNHHHRQIAYKMLDICKSTVEAYLENMTARDEEGELDVGRLISETAGFAGMELISRAIGATPAEDVRSDGAKEAEILQSGERLVQRYQRIQNIGQLLNVALMLT